MRVRDRGDGALMSMLINLPGLSELDLSFNHLKYLTLRGQRKMGRGLQKTLEGYYVYNGFLKPLRHGMVSDDFPLKKKSVMFR